MSTPKSPDSVATDQVVLILCGLIGSGKSTFAEALESFVPRFRRCNQDDLGNRKNVEARVRQCLKDGLSVCVDRTNFDPAQRSTWVNIARGFPGTSVWVLVLDTPYKVCEERIKVRKEHPTITSPELGLSVLNRLVNDFKPPSANEGFDRIFSLLPHPTPTYSFEDVEAILDAIEASPAIPRPSPRGTPGMRRNPGHRISPSRGTSFSRPNAWSMGRGSNSNMGWNRGQSTTTVMPTRGHHQSLWSSSPWAKTMAQETSASGSSVALPPSSDTASPITPAASDPAVTDPSAATAPARTSSVAPPSSTTDVGQV